MDKLFGTNGVRGVFSEDFTLEFVHDLVLAISTYFKEGRILVGYDGRDSSVVVSKLVCSTLNYRWHLIVILLVLFLLLVWNLQLKR